MGQVVSVRSHGVTEVEQTWQQFVPSARLHRIDPRNVGFSWASVELPHFTTVAYELSAGVRASIDMDHQVMACRISGDKTRVRSGAQDLDARSPWLGVDRPIEAEWGRTGRVRAFVFDRPHVEQVVRTITGDDGFVLRAADPRASSRTAAVQWERSFAYVSTALAASHDDPLIAAELQRHALMTTLAAFATNYLDTAEQTTQRASAPRSVRRALAYIDAHAHLPITLDDIARAAGMSTRGLQHAFRRALDTTPSARLREVRLAAAHDELRTGTATVSEIARRWGFSNPSRFAPYYRDAYGRNPGHTLKMR